MLSVLEVRLTCGDPYTHTQHMPWGVRPHWLLCPVWCFFGTGVSDWRAGPEQPAGNRQSCKEMLNIDAPELQERRGKCDSTLEL